MKKNKQISENNKARIKANFNRINPDKLRPAERAYYNKVKAGKARAASAFTDKTGKYTKFSTGFIDKTIKPILKAKQIEPTAQAVKEYLSIKSNLEAAEGLFKGEVLSWYYNPGEIAQALKKGTHKTELFIQDGNGLVKVSPEQAEKAIKEYEQRIHNMGAAGFKYRVDFKEGFSKGIINLPDLTEYEENGGENLDELNAEGEIHIYISGAKNKKGKKNAKTQKNKNRKK